MVVYNVQTIQFPSSHTGSLTLTGTTHILVCTPELFEGRKESVWYTLHRSIHTLGNSMRCTSFPCNIHTLAHQHHQCACGHEATIIYNIDILLFFLSFKHLHMYCACWTRLMKNILYRDTQYILARKLFLKEQAIAR